MFFCQLPMVNFKDTKKYFLLVRMVNVQGNAWNTKKSKNITSHNTNDDIGWSPPLEWRQHIHL